MYAMVLVVAGGSAAAPDIDTLLVSLSFSPSPLSGRAPAPCRCHLWIIGAGRLDARAHPNRIIEMQLQPLAPIFVKQLVMDSFRVNDEQGMVLANLLHSRTAGNPFAMSACLKHLYAKGLLHFDHALSSWLWDIEGIRKTTVSEDSAALLLESMQGLSKDEQLVLQYAACSGNRVDLYSLSLYLQKSGMSVQRVAAVCVALEQSGLLLCISHAKDLLLVSQAASPSTNSSATLACSTDALAPADATVASASTSSSSSSSGMASPSEMLSPTRLASRLSAIRCAFAVSRRRQRTQHSDQAAACVRSFRFFTQL